MTVLDRTLLTRLTLALLFVTLALTAAVWLTQSLRFLDIAVNGSAPFGLYLRLVALALPQFLVVILPVALFIATLSVYARLNADSEAVVLRAGGIDHWRLARPALFLGAATSLLLLLLGGWGAPLAGRELKELRALLRGEYADVLLREGVFNAVGDGVTVYIERREGGDLLDLMIHDARARRPVTIFARRGALIAGQRGTQVRVQDGRREVFDPTSGRIDRQEFADYLFDLSAYERIAEARWLEPSERTLPELMRPDLSSAADLANLGALDAERHVRLAQPWFAVTLVLVAVTALLTGSVPRQGQVPRIALACAAALVLQGAVLGLAGAARLGPAWIVLLHVVSFGAPLLLASLFDRLAETTAHRGWLWPGRRAVGVT